MRILKFIGAFLGTLALIFFLVFGFNLQALSTLFNNGKDLQEGKKWVPKTRSLKGLTEYIGENPTHVSLSSQSATNPDTTIGYGSEKDRTMGTLSNFFLITTYARLVENGSLNPDEGISLDQIDRLQLPYIDASNHENAQNALENQDHIDEHGKVTLDELVEKAIIFNDLAISDYLFNKLGISAINETMAKLELKHTDAPLPFSGLYITAHPRLHNASFDERFKKLQQMADSTFRDSVMAATDRFMNDESFHKQVMNTFDDEQGLGTGFTERRDALSLFPQSTAGELSNLMIRLQKDSVISAAVSKRVKAIMDWPHRQQSQKSDFKYYGAIYDNRLGLLNGLDYGASVYSNEPFGQAVFFDSLQVAFWFHMSSNLMHQDYQQRLMWDPALRTTTTKKINQK